MAQELQYEQQRNARLLENRKRMEALGLLDLSKSLTSSASNKNPTSRWKHGPHPENNSFSKEALRPRSLARAAPRRSSRLSGAPQPCYKEVEHVSELAARSNRLDPRQCQPEIYTEEHEKLLGHCLEDWELFKDGYDSNGVRIYDSERGKTCHQCRQKTMGLRTWCSECESLRGQFCGDCLFMRYGENVIETTKNKTWVCPVCRGICNCSFCRLKKGWAPTGSMYRLVLQLDYKSVAHYLVMTRREGASIDIDQAASPQDTSADEGTSTVEDDPAARLKASADECVETMDKEEHCLMAHLPEEEKGASLIERSRDQSPERSKDWGDSVKEEEASMAQMPGQVEEEKTAKTIGRKRGRPRKETVAWSDPQTPVNQKTLAAGGRKGAAKEEGTKRGRPRKNCGISIDPPAEKLVLEVSSSSDNDTDMGPPSSVRKPLFVACGSSIVHRLRNKLPYAEAAAAAIQH